jgi:predicted transcriptional regulator
MPDTQFEFTNNDADRLDRRAELARALARGGMEGIHVISIETAQKTLSPRRMEIVELLQEEEVESVRGLARRLDRDKGQVSRDLGDLAEHGIIEYQTDGRAKIPRLAQEHLVIEPLV